MQRRRQHQPYLALLQDIRGAVALSRLRTGISDQLVAECKPVKVRGLPRIAYIELNIIRAVQRQEVLLRLSFGMGQGRHCFLSKRAARQTVIRLPNPPTYTGVARPRHP